MKLFRSKQVIFILSLCLIFGAGLFSISARAGWEHETSWVYEEEDGSRRRDEWITDEKGRIYYVDQQGNMVTGWYRHEDGSKRFYDQSGIMLRGINLIDGRYYYFDEKGELSFGRAEAEGRYWDIPEEGVSKDGMPTLSVDEYENGQKAVSAGEESPYESMNELAAALVALAGGALYLMFRKKKEGREVLFLGIAVVFASLPLFTRYLIYGHDLEFHLNRILGIAASLRDGMFPVRINGFTFWGYGYPDPVFYPQLFLYIPAVLHMIGLPLPVAVHVFFLGVNGLTAAVMYYCGKTLFQSSSAACVSAILYTLAVYRLSNLYTRAAYGEFLAMVWFPLVICGLYELFYGNEKRWWLLPVAFTGIFQSHIISTLLTAAACVITGACSLGRLRDKKRLLALGKAAVFTVFMNLWFLVPLVEYMGTEINTSVLAFPFEKYSAPWPALLKIFPVAEGVSPEAMKDLSQAMPLTMGLAVFCGMILYAGWRLGKKWKPEKKSRVFFAAGTVLLVLASSLVPWHLLVKIPLIRMITSYIQFPWRLVGVALCMLCLVGGYTFSALYGKLKEREETGGKKTFLYTTVLILALVSSQFYLDGITQMPAFIWNTDQVPGNIQKQEYLYTGTEVESLKGEAWPSDQRVHILESGNDVLSAYCSYEIQGDMEGAYIDMPVLFFPGYRAEDENGSILPVERGRSNVVRVYPMEPKGQIRVYFQERRLWRLMELVSLLSAAGFVTVVLRERRKSLYEE